MCLRAVLTTLNRLSQALTCLTLVQEDTKISTLQKNIWIGPKKLSSLPSSYKSKTPVVLVTYPLAAGDFLHHQTYDVNLLLRRDRHK
jgi:hypothetical protein